MSLGCHYTSCCLAFSVSAVLELSDVDSVWSLRGGGTLSSFEGGAGSFSLGPFPWI